LRPSGISHWIIPPLISRDITVLIFL